MNCEPRRYVPCLRWKQGEYQALLKLSAEARGGIFPIIEVAEIGYDFETRQSCKSIDEHLKPVARRIADKWGNGACFVDLRHVNLAQNMADGTSPVTFLFKGLRDRGVAAIPVTSIGETGRTRTAIQGVAIEDCRGACVRITLEELGSGSFQSSLSRLLSDIKLAASDCDLVLDLGAPNFEPLDGFTQLLARLIRRIPYLMDWRAFVIIATSFPASMVEVPLGMSRIPRKEWLLYKELVRRFHKENVRLPDFGDYAVAHPLIPQADMRFVKPSASLRYTIADGWLIARGPNVRDHKFEQYRGLCQLVVDSGCFDADSAWFADTYIAGCAAGHCSTGTLTTWRQVGTNRHIERVARDYASFAAFAAGA
jgi:hypothetical protein